MWLPPGGHIDDNETPDEAVVREIKEETGLDVELLGSESRPDPADGKVRFLKRPALVQLENIDDPKGFHQHVDLIYFCRPTGGKLRLAAGELDCVRWFSPDDLGSAEIVEEVRDTGRRAISEVSGCAV